MRDTHRPGRVGERGAGLGDLLDDPFHDPTQQRLPA